VHQQRHQTHQYLQNYVRERHQCGITKVTHIPGVINASALFTKELKDAAHFRQCRDTFMVSKAVFDHHGCIVPSHHQTKEDLPFYSLQSKTIPWKPAALLNLAGK
jgi:hypothetical protein